MLAVFFFELLHSVGCCEFLDSVEVAFPSRVQRDVLEEQLLFNKLDFSPIKIDKLQKRNRISS